MFLTCGTIYLATQGIFNSGIMTIQTKSLKLLQQSAIRFFFPFLGLVFKMKLRFRLDHIFWMFFFFYYEIKKG